jgi:hypothetical protein
MSIQMAFFSNLFMIQFLFVFMHGSSNYPEKQKHCHRIVVNAAICGFRCWLFLEKS